MFFALPEFSTSTGRVVNATFGMAKFFMNSLSDYNPDYVFFVKDAKGKNFRHDIYADYKATRDRMPDALRSQIPDIYNMIDALWIGTLVQDGFEADDLIGTLATKLWATWEYQVVILSGDKDLYSLVWEHIKIYDTMKQRLYGPDETKDKYGIESTMIIDYLAIMWDSADNIPGIEWFGPKKAVTLINSLGSIEDIYKMVDRVESGEIDPLIEFAHDTDLLKLFKWKTYEKLVGWKESAFLSKQLATIDLNVDIWDDFSIGHYAFEPQKLLNEQSIALFQEFEFHSLLGSEKPQRETWDNLNLDVQIISNTAELNDLTEKIQTSQTVVLDTETTSLDIIDADLVGVSIYLDDKNIFYINRLHTWDSVSDDELKIFIKMLLDADIILVGHNIKYDLEIIQRFLAWKTVSDILNTDSQMSLWM